MDDIDEMDDFDEAERTAADIPSFFRGDHETLMLESGEADLESHFKRCRKYSGHKEFIPVKDFTIRHLPARYQKPEIIDVIRATSFLAVRITVKFTSNARPQFFPDTQDPYPFYDKRGYTLTRIGSGRVDYVAKYTVDDNGTCQCSSCKYSTTPSKVWGRIWIYTATHVVFDMEEARHAKARLFYDTDDSSWVEIEGMDVWEAQIDNDMCRLICVTCDVDLVDKLMKGVEFWKDARRKANQVLNLPNSEQDLAVVVSHPHGCPKKISVGRWVHKFDVRTYEVVYAYTTCTCPGSSGADVYTLAGDGLLFTHTHKGANREGSNYSGIGVDFPGG